VAGGAAGEGTGRLGSGWGTGAGLAGTRPIGAGLRGAGRLRFLHTFFLRRVRLSRFHQHFLAGARFLFLFLAAAIDFTAARWSSTGRRAALSAAWTGWTIGA
jgi:hypothetical protein